MDHEIIEKHRLSGKIAGEALQFGRALIKPGVALLDVAEKVETYIEEHGGEVAFPVNLAINEIAAHFTPKHDDTDLVFHIGDVVKLDIGAHIDGYIADTALTVEVGSRNWKELILASEDALRVAIETLRPGIPVGMIGARVEQTIQAHNFDPISNLTGHSLEQYNLHAGLSIPNIEEMGSECLKAGDFIAIEPFATNGAGRVDGSKPSNIYIFKTDRPVRNKRARELLEHIKTERKGLPFSERFCARYVPKPKKIIQYLVRVGAISSYPILSDIDDGIVSQHEHTILITETGCEVLTQVT